MRYLYQIFVHVAYRRGSVLPRRGDEIPKGRGSFGVFLPIDTALYSIAFGTNTKAVEPIEVPFGMMTRVGPKYHVLHGDPIPQREGAIFGGCPGHLKALAIFAAAGPFNRQ